MNPAAAPLSQESFEQRMMRVDRGVRLFGMTFLVLSSAGNLLLAWAVKAVAASVPASVLASLSTFSQYALAHPQYVLGLAVVLPLAGSIITLRAKDPFKAMTAVSIYLVLVTLQFAATTCVLGAPIAAVLHNFGSTLSRL